MRDLRQNNEPVYYGAYQQQATDGNQLRDAEQRHDELRQLEGNIVQLHEIHRDFAELVSGHHQIIDNIELDVAKTETQVITSTKNLGKAVQLQSAARRKIILCGAISCILIAIVIIVVAIVATKKSK